MSSNYNSYSGGKSVSRIITDSVLYSLNDILGSDNYYSLLAQIGITSRIDMNNEIMVFNNPEKVEKAIYDILGSGSEILFKHINDSLIRLFPQLDANLYKYRQYGDYSKLLNTIRELYNAN